MFSTLSIIFTSFKLLSANALNLVLSNILLLGKILSLSKIKASVDHKLSVDQFMELVLEGE